MRYAILIIGAVTATGIAAIAGASESAAQVYPWCATYARGETNCGFSTLAQCEAARSGNGGLCRENPFYFATDPMSGGCRHRRAAAFCAEHRVRPRRRRARATIQILQIRIAPLRECRSSRPTF